MLQAHGNRGVIVQELFLDHFMLCTWFKVRWLNLGNSELPRRLVSPPLPRQWCLACSNWVRTILALSPLMAPLVSRGVQHYQRWASEERWQRSRARLYAFYLELSPCVNREVGAQWLFFHNWSVCKNYSNPFTWLLLGASESVSQSVLSGKSDLRPALSGRHLRSTSPTDAPCRHTRGPADKSCLLTFMWMLWLSNLALGCYLFLVVFSYVIMLCDLTLDTVCDRVSPWQLATLFYCFPTPQLFCSL